MKVTVITVCFNSAETISHTIKSVASQVDSDYEHIVVDGASSDGTVELVKIARSVTKFVTEPDKGIYDAMNKGIVMATGDIVGTLNADDYYANENVLKDVAYIFTDPTVEACYADLEYVSQKNTNQVVRYWKSKDYTSGLFKSGWMPAHPTFFVRRSVYERFGVFDLNYKIAADFELLFRLIEQNKIKTKYLPKVLIKMRLGGTTNKNISNIINQNKEIIAILKNHYPNISVFKFILNKLYNRFFQFILRP
jgi:glycosyltransferase involved in cell wall biosynthesis